jgi:DUF2075 family protein
MVTTALIGAIIGAIFGLVMGILWNVLKPKDVRNWSYVIDNVIQFAVIFGIVGFFLGFI